MKIFEKIRVDNRRIVKMFGFTLFSYTRGTAQAQNFTSSPSNTLINVPAWCVIAIYGERNRVVFGEKCDQFVGPIYIGMPDCLVNDCIIEIGEGCTSNGCMIRLMEDNTKLSMGSDCMLSDNISIWASDTHTITDASGKIINWGKFVEIGSHVWIGTGVTILKNTKIPSGTIVGAHSVVSGCKIKEENCIIAGSPAKVVKTNVTWHRERPKQYSRAANL